MGRKKTNPGIYLYPHDILSSPRCRSLTPGAAGIYFFLFLRLCDPPVPGAYRLRDWEPHPKWQKSDTRKCVRIADKRERLPLFAKWLAKNDLPWTKNEVLPYLQELYDRGIIIIEGDMLIQPRLYVDNGFEIPDIDGDGDPIGSILDDPVSGQMRACDNTLQGGLNLRKNKGTENGTEKRTENGTKKGTKKSRVGTGDAPAHSKRVGVRDNNINDDNDKKEDKKKKTGKNNPVADNPPTLEDIQAYMDERAQQGKPFVYVTAESFLDACEQSGWALKDGKPMIDWRARMRTFENYRKEHGDRPVAQGRGQIVTPQKVGDPVAATKPSKDKYKNKW